MKTTRGLPVTVAISARLPRTRLGLRGHSRALAPRGRSPMLLLALLGAGLARIASGGLVFTEFPTPLNSLAGQIAAGPDGNLWFTGNGVIGRITTAGVITEFPLTFGSAPSSIAAGPDGNVWFTDQGHNKIGRITTAGVVTDFGIPTASSAPVGITAGSDGNIWFTEQSANQIGRITTAGVVTEFLIPTASSFPQGIAAGADGNVWFTELYTANQIGRITAAGVITEFPVPTALGWGIAAGADGNIWFTEAGKIGRITAAGVITEFPLPAGGGAIFIAAGPDGNLWFTDYYGCSIGRITTAGLVTEFCVPTAGGLFGIAAGSDGNLWSTEHGADKIARITPPPATPQLMIVDAHAVTGSISNANGVLEPGETVQVDPAWKNTLIEPQTFTGIASNLTGPAGPTYTINDGSADYGTVAPGAAADCDSATSDCYLMTVSGTRPLGHLDATFTEKLSSNSMPNIWTLHVGGSFTDVSTDIVVDPYYPSIETIVHNQVSVGCQDGTTFCPTDPTTRQEMAVFLLKASQGSSFHPPACADLFSDVPCTPGVGFSDWIENLYNRGITAGCQAPGDPLMYCPTRDVLRSEMAVFLLKASHGSSFDPPDCHGIFSDVPCTPGVGFSDWIEEIYNRGITSGCQAPGDPLMYCPDNNILRQEMAVFLVKAFGLKLY